MVEAPPIISSEDILDALSTKHSADVVEIVEKINSEYLYWSDVKYQKLPENLTAEQVWKIAKAYRRLNQTAIWNRYGIKLSITPVMQRVCHHFDMNFGGSWGANSIIPEDNKTQYLISSLMEEAISSSQMEGASTTRRKAKEMLRKRITPSDKSQQMILNNYQTIQYIAENKDAMLSKEMLLKIHSLMTEKTLENSSDEGCFRTNDDIVVEDGITHQTIYTPPTFEDLPEFVDQLCLFFNDSNPKVFIHPIIRGIIIHFMIGYMHPFVDGNGRTARALFYWYMLKRGYWLTEYMSISRVIYKTKKAYEKAYIHTETDQNDMGYFVNYNIKVLEKAFKELQSYIKRKQEQKKETYNIFMRIGNINPRQAQILNILYQNPNEILTVKELQTKFGITPTTAKTDLIGLVNMNLVFEIPFNKVKKGYAKGAKFDDVIAKI